MPLNALAADSASAFQDIVKLNRIAPMQNPQYTLAEDVISRNIISRKNRVIGETQDLIMAKDGQVMALYVDLKNRNHTKQAAYLNIEALEVQFLNDAYRVNFDRNQIADILPQILASTATASGEGAEEVALSNIIGQPIRDSKGRSLGRAQTVLFKHNGKTADAIAVAISKHTIMALPFGAITITPPANSRSSAKLTIADEYVTAARSFIKDN